MKNGYFSEPNYSIGSPLGSSREYVSCIRKLIQSIGSPSKGKGDYYIITIVILLILVGGMGLLLYIILININSNTSNNRA